MTWTTQQAGALQAVFSALNKSGMKWMVLRNYEGLPATNQSKDVDLLFAKINFLRARQIISETLKKLNFNYYEYTRFQCIWCFTFYNIIESPPISLKIDLLDGFVWRGATVVSFTDLYTRKVKYSDFYVPDPIYDGFMLWIKPLMTGGFIKQKYRADICSILKKDSHEFYTLLGKTVGNNMADKVWPILASGNLEATVPYQRQLCHSAWLVAFHNDLAHTMSATIEHFYREIVRRSNRPKAAMIAVIGPDGAGKTTFIEHLQKELCRILVRDTDGICIQHFRPHIIPNIKKLLSGNRYDESSELFTDPHRAKPAGFLSSLFRITYYWFDYLLGYWLHIRSRCISGKVYIFDRYFYDFIVDPYRSRIRLPKWIRMIMLKITPEPDLVFFLNSDAETIYGRKQELGLPEIERQLAAYRALVSLSGRFEALDASKTPTEICHCALRQLIIKSFRPVQGTP